ncbi:protein-glutamine gamma-glutamyltransferase E-like [Bombina bombina]|uniref:protein-glutamine gamma-glutamyltransferase E-like n=1 Tax=Bombina bombina TaxID=8345 RepID=UPI00235B0EF8|nr:protein-glutamine gamma-glutamyltransferase E-like [Bombina bombina]XP_053549295.1 protein-glutamine gamma-glutamyltransferase E-like [Bombina bombina]
MTEMLSQMCKSLTDDIKLCGQFKITGAREVGKDINLILVITNKTDKANKLNVKIKAFSILYTKKEMNELLNESRDLCLGSNEEKEIPVTIAYVQYEDLLTADNTVEVTAICSTENNETMIAQTNVVLENPKIEIKLQGQAKVNLPVTANVIFTNPLNKEVRDIVVIAEGSGLIKDPITIKAGNAKPKEAVTVPIIMTPYKSGCRHLLVDLTCNKFFNIKGYLEIKVHEEEEDNSAPKQS